MAEINLGRVVGSDANVTKVNVENALGYTPADEDIIGLLSSLTTDEKANLVGAINEVKSQANENVAKASIIQTTEVNDSTKIPSSAVTFGIKAILDNTINKMNAASGLGDANITNRGFEVRVCSASTLNTPTPNEGVLVHIEGGSQYSLQIFASLGVNELYHRTKYGTWKPWKKVTAI